jgi:hypothetical protein
MSSKNSEHDIVKDIEELFPGKIKELELAIKEKNKHIQNINIYEFVTAHCISSFVDICEEFEVEIS